MVSSYTDTGSIGEGRATNLHLAWQPEIGGSTTPQHDNHAAGGRGDTSILGVSLPSSCRRLLF